MKYEFVEYSIYFINDVDVNYKIDPLNLEEAIFYLTIFKIYNIKYVFYVYTYIDRYFTYIPYDLNNNKLCMK